MLYELSADQLANVAPLFQKEMAAHPFCAGVILGKYSGKIVVDHPDNPTCAFIFKPGLWAFLGGDVQNQAFVDELSQALIKKEIVNENQWGLVFTLHDPAWRPILDRLLPERHAISTSRLLYTANKDHQVEVRPLSAELQAAGYALHFIDDSFSDCVDGKLPGPVQEVVTLRAEAEVADEAAFGYVVVKDQQCVAWSMVNVIVATHGDITLETQPAHRKRSLGMIASSATIDYGLKHGLTQLHWDVIGYNTASIKMAEKHGLALHLKYEQHLLIYGEMSYLANIAYTHLDNQEYRPMLELCEKVLKLDNGKMHGNFLAAAAHAGLGDSQRSFQHLYAAVDNGFDDLGELTHTPAFDQMRRSAEWDELVKQISA